MESHWYINERKFSFIYFFEHTVLLKKYEVD